MTYYARWQTTWLLRPSARDTPQGQASRLTICTVLLGEPFGIHGILSRFIPFVCVRFGREGRNRTSGLLVPNQARCHCATSRCTSTGIRTLFPRLRTWSLTHGPWRQVASGEGFEPPTSWSRTRRSTGLNYPEMKQQSSRCPQATLFSYGFQESNLMSAVKA